MNKEQINKEIIATINYLAEKYKYHGFWLKGKCTWEGEQINPYLYFPSEDVCREELMNVFNALTEKDYEPKVVSFCQTYDDGDEITDLPKPVEGNIVINTVIRYNEDGPYAEVCFTYSGYETDEMIVNRLSTDVWYKATDNYIKSLKR